MNTYDFTIVAQRLRDNVYDVYVRIGNKEMSKHTFRGTETQLKSYMSKLEDYSRKKYNNINPKDRLSMFCPHLVIG